MGVEFEIGGNRSDEIREAMEDAVKVAVDAAGLQASSYAKMELQKSPSRIDTGLLRNSITHAVGGSSPAISEYSASNPSKRTGKTPSSGGYGGAAPADTAGQATAYIGTNVEYGVYVHEGTTKMAPNRFLKNAVERNQKQLVEIISKVLRETST